jgi:hypothetical protein
LRQCQFPARSERGRHSDRLEIGVTAEQPNLGSAIHERDIEDRATCRDGATIGENDERTRLGGDLEMGAAAQQMNLALRLVEIGADGALRIERHPGAVIQRNRTDLSDPGVGRIGLASPRAGLDSRDAEISENRQDRRDRRNCDTPMTPRVGRRTILLA